MKNAKDSKAMTADEELEIMDNTLADMQEAMIVDTDDTETEPYPDRSLWKRIGAMLLWTDGLVLIVMLVLVLVLPLS